MKFEYKIDNCWGSNTEHTTFLNRMGAKGWELVSAISLQGTFVKYIFKRTKGER